MTTTSNIFNAYWLISTSLAIWFLFVHSPPIFLERLRSSGSQSQTKGLVLSVEHPLFVIHLAGSYTVYLSCIFSSLIHPLMSGTTRIGGSINSAVNRRQVHMLIGRIGLVAGTVGFVAGVLLIVNNSDTIDQGFAIGITIGGFLQMRLQYKGYESIRQYQQFKRIIATQNWKKFGKAVIDKKDYYGTDKDTVVDGVVIKYKIEKLKDERDEALRNHIQCMISLFVMACGIPAMMRLVETVLARKSVWVNLFMLIPMNVFSQSYGKLMSSLIVVSDNTSDNTSAAAADHHDDEGGGDDDNNVSSTTKLKTP